jgi:hypothetical protein
VESLTGDGAEQRKGEGGPKQALNGFQPAPSDNAASVTGGTCGVKLPSKIKPSDDSAPLTGICKLGS